MKTKESDETFWNELQSHKKQTFIFTLIVCILPFILFTIVYFTVVILDDILDTKASQQDIEQQKL